MSYILIGRDGVVRAFRDDNTEIPLSKPVLLDAGPSQKGWSNWQTAVQCPQLHALIHVVPRESGGLNPFAHAGPALVRGGIGHVGLAHLYAREKIARAGGSVDQVFDCEAAVRIVAGGHPDGERWIDPVLSALDAYRTRYSRGSSLDPGLEILAVERELSGWMTSETGARYRYTQRADLIVRDNNGVLIPGVNGTRGKVCVLDHKCVGYLDKKAIQRYALDGQFLGYIWFGVQHWGTNFGGAFLNMLEISEREGTRLRRVPCPPAPEAVREYPQTIVDAGDLISRLQAEGRDPWHWPRRISSGLCWTLYGPCPATEYCRWGRDGAPSDEA